jgi:hypothetical protein
MCKMYKLFIDLTLSYPHNLKANTPILSSRKPIMALKFHRRYKCDLLNNHS